MTALFKHSNGRLKTSRMAFFVFIILLICLSSAYKMGKSADKVLLKIEHVFEAPKDEEKIKEPAVRKVVKALEHPVPEKPLEVKQEQIPDVEPSETKHKKHNPVAVKEKKLVEKKIEKLAQKPVKKSAKNPIQKPDFQTNNKSLDKLQTVKKAAQSKRQTVETVKKDKIQKPTQKDQVRFTMAQDLKLKSDLNQKSLKSMSEKSKILKLSSKEYFETYRQWQEQGKTLDKEKTLVNLRILNLEKVYDLFQMKAVVIKDGEPHTDLDDNSRIANASLSEFSSTCFIVNRPWKKWGDALKDAGFTENDNIEVRYYTYEFVRNSIYARAQKAFEWSAEKLNLPEKSDPSKSDVLGKVYAVNKAGGGAFGVFVPLRVDSQSSGSVKIDPLACFKGQKDILALSNAGLLNN